MRRKKHESAFDVIPPVAGLLLLLLYFFPAFRFLLLVIVAIIILAAVTLFIFREVTYEPHYETTARPLSQNTCSPIADSAKTAAVESLSDKLRSIDWFQFEKLVGAIYQAQGYSVQRLGGAKPDGGVDLTIQRDGVKSAVQCKHWKNSEVPVKEIREFLGTITDTQIPNGIFITLQGFTSDARALAAKHKIQLLDEPELLKLLESIDWKWNPGISSALESTAKRCPKCEREMILRTATKGRNSGNQFWGCSAYPRCRYILNYS